MTGRRHTPTDLTTPDAATGAAPSVATGAATGAATSVATGAATGASLDAATEAATGAVAGARTGAAVRADAVPDPDAPGKWRGRVSVVQVAGGAMAALTAAVAASWLGVAGTVIGAAVMSVATTVGTELYTHYLRRTRAKVRQHTVTGRRHRPSDRARPSGPAHPSDQAHPTDQAPAGRVGWLRLGGAAALVFTLSFGGILIYQAIAGQTVSEQLKGATEGKAVPAGRDAGKDRRTEPALRHSRPYPVSPTPSGSPSPTPSATGPLATPSASATVTATAPSPTDAPTDRPAAPPAQEPTDRPATPPPTGAEPTEPPPPAPSPSAPLSGLLPFP
ncbi:hypothetical protein [Nonomuraea sp. NPDC003214]